MMDIGFDNLHQHIIPMDDFALKWRFTDERYDKLPEDHLAQLKPLDHNAAAFLWNYIADNRLHEHIPFRKDYFKVIDKAKISLDNQADIRKWLYRRGFPFDKNIYLSWQPREAMIVPWKLFVKYFDSFYYSDDLTIIDQSLNWALLFYHEDEIYFGTKEAYTKGNSFDHINFSW